MFTRKFGKWWSIVTSIFFKRVETTTSFFWGHEVQWNLGSMVTDSIMESTMGWNSPGQTHYDWGYVCFRTSFSNHLKQIEGWQHGPSPPKQPSLNQVFIINHMMPTIDPKVLRGPSGCLLYMRMWCFGCLFPLLRWFLNGKVHGKTQTKTPLHPKFPSQQRPLPTNFQKGHDPKWCYFKAMSSFWSRIPFSALGTSWQSWQSNKNSSDQNERWTVLEGSKGWFSAVEFFPRKNWTCVSPQKGTLSHRIHGTSIFTYMKTIKINHSCR